MTSSIWERLNACNVRSDGWLEIPCIHQSKRQKCLSGCPIFGCVDALINLFSLSLSFLFVWIVIKVRPSRLLPMPLFPHKTRLAIVWKRFLLLPLLRFNHYFYHSRAISVALLQRTCTIRIIINGQNRDYTKQFVILWKIKTLLAVVILNGSS